MTRYLRLGKHTLDLSRPRVMGILNVTPDSFSDGGRFFDRERALDHARRMIADGADIIDVGGESTRPGAPEVGEADELARVLPLVATLAGEGALVSIDTTKPRVMREAVAAGAAMINDVRALLEPGAVDAAAATDAAVCLMHMRGTPRTMQSDTHYDDVVAEVRRFLIERARASEAAGIARERIAIDPGFGFGKDVVDWCRAWTCLRRADTRSSPGCRGSRRWESLRGEVPGNGSQPVSPRCSRRSVAARASCACTTFARASMHWLYGTQ